MSRPPEPSVVCRVHGGLVAHPCRQDDPHRAERIIAGLIGVMTPDRVAAAAWSYEVDS